MKRFLQLRQYDADVVICEVEVTGKTEYEIDRIRNKIFDDLEQYFYIEEVKKTK